MHQHVVMLFDLLLLLICKWRREKKTNEHPTPFNGIFSQFHIIAHSLCFFPSVISLFACPQFWILLLFLFALQTNALLRCVHRHHHHPRSMFRSIWPLFALIRLCVRTNKRMKNRTEKGETKPNKAKRHKKERKSLKQKWHSVRLITGECARLVPMHGTANGKHRRNEQWRSDEWAAATNRSGNKWTNDFVRREKYKTCVDACNANDSPNVTDDHESTNGVNYPQAFVLYSELNSVVGIAKLLTHYNDNWTCIYFIRCRTHDKATHRLCAEEERVSGNNLLLSALKF